MEKSDYSSGSPAKNRYLLLDVYKILCVVIIVFHHYQQFFNVKFKLFNFYGGNFEFGYLVELFFMISGFVFYKSEIKNSMPPFYSFARRIIRLFPMALLACFSMIVIAVAYFFIFGNWFESLYTNPITIITSLTLTFSGFPFLDRIGINNPAWYLCVLIQCYFAFYLVETLCHKKSKNIKICLYLFFILMLLALKIFHLPSFMQNSHRGYICFFIGLLISMFSERIVIKKWWWIIPFFLGVALCIFLNKYYDYYWYPLVFAVFPSLILLGCSCLCIESKTIKRICLISFDVYLFHAPVERLTKLIDKAFGEVITYDFWFMLVFLFIVILISTGIHFFVENNINKLFRKAVSNNGQ